MKTFLFCWLVFLAASVPLVAQTQTPPPAAAPSVSADAAPPPSAPPQRTAAELEKLAMPIALHPDPLISIILPAAAYPVEIVQAARFVKDTNNIPKIDQQPWDENVKAVARFPDLIAKMDADLNWTIALGQAFVEQPKELMDTIQSLRSKAQKAGTLQTTPQQVVTVTNVIILQTNVTQVVTVTNQIVQVQPANPQVVYVPTYPTTVYYPPPTYVYDPWAPLVSFGVGMAVGAIIANNCDWHGGCVWVGGGGYHGDVDVDIDIDRNININDNRQNTKSGSRSATTSAKTTQQKWQPDQSRMRSSGAPTSAQSLDARGWSGGSATAANRATSPAAGSARPSTQPAQRPASAQAAQPAARPSTGSTWSSPSAQPRSGSGATSTWQQPSGSRQAPSAASRPSPSPSVSRPSPSSSSAFNGVSNGGAARSASSRGGASRGGGRGR